MIKIKDWIKQVEKKTGHRADIKFTDKTISGIMEYEIETGKILIPKKSLRLDEAHFKFVLAHEIGHAQNPKIYRIDRDKAEVLADRYAKKFYPMPKDYKAHELRYKKAANMEFEQKSETHLNTAKPYRITKIRKRRTKHEGGSPLTVPTTKKSNKEIKMEGKELTRLHTWTGLMKQGVAISLGMGAARVVNGVVSGAIPNVPFKATIGSGIATAGLFMGYKAIPSQQGFVKEMVEYAAAGSAAFTLGALIGEGLGMAGVQLPDIVAQFLGVATGTPQVSVQAEEGVDLNTALF